MYYPNLTVNSIEGVQNIISGPIHDVLSLQHQYDTHIAENLCFSHVAQPVPSSTSPVDIYSTATGSESPSGIKEFPNLNPDVLALLQKVPEGNIHGVKYDTKRGCLLLNSCSSEEEYTRISRFQAVYHDITSRKIKVDAVEIPKELSNQTIKDIISSFDDKYSQCAFVCHEDPRAVRVISSSSRQFEQAKKILKDRLKQALNKEAVGATALTSSESMVIPIAGGRKLTLKQADITKEEVDIIVNAANRNLEHGGGVAGAIDRASNGTVQRISYQYIKKHGRLSAGQVAVTRAGGSLKCKHVIHAVGPTKSDYNLIMCEHLLFDVMKKVLQEAEKIGACSISIPAISSGIFGVGKELVARCVTDSILTFNFRKPLPTLIDIRIVIIDQPTHSCFARYFATKMAALAPSKPAPDDVHKTLIQPAKLTLPSPAAHSAPLPHSSNPPPSLTMGVVPLGNPPLPMEPHREFSTCLLYTSPSPRDATLSRMPSSA